MEQQIKYSSLVAASLDIGRILADHNSIKFYANGMCMYPVIHPRDILQIESRSVATVNVGDIAVCRGKGFLFSHRIIEKNKLDGRMFIMTRPDDATNECDKPTFDEDLLGVVSRIIRHGKSMSLQPKQYSWINRFYFSVHLMFIRTYKHARFFSIKVLMYFQKHKLYRKFAKILLKIIQWRTKFAIRLPLNGILSDVLYRPLTPDKFNLLITSINHWTLALLLNNGHKPIAWVTFVSNTANVWCIRELSVRVLYRGMGIEDLLIQEAGKILKMGDNNVKYS
jgi:hypothetical protein